MILSIFSNFFPFHLRKDFNSCFFHILFSPFDLQEDFCSTFAYSPLYSYISFESYILIILILLPIFPYSHLIQKELLISPSIISVPFLIISVSLVKLIQETLLILITVVRQIIHSCIVNLK